MREAGQDPDRHRLRLKDLAILMVVLALSIVMTAGTASAGVVSALDPLIPFAFILMGLSVIGLILAWKAPKSWMKPKYRPLLATSAVIVLLISGIALIPAAPAGPTGTTFKFELIPTVDTTGGDTIPAGNYDACDTEAGGTTGEWTTTEGTYDAGSKGFISREAIDTDNAITAALFMEPNCLQMAFSVRLLNGVDANGDGTTDNVNYYMQIASISRTSLATDGSNGTLNTAGFRRDGVSETNDWLLLYRTDASVWVASCPEARTSSSVPSSCGWVNVGNHNGGAADTIFAYVILQDRGLFGYQEPALGSSVVITYNFGGPNVETQTYTLTVTLNTRGTTNLA